MGLLLLCAHWRLRSDRWRRRGNRPTRTLPQPRPQQPQAQQQQQAVSVVERLPTTLTEPLHAQAVWAHIGSVLRPLSLRWGPLLSGPDAAALVARDPAAARLYWCEIGAVRVIEADTVAQHQSILSLQLSLRAAEQRLPDAAATTPATSYALPPAVQAVAGLVHLGAAHFSELVTFMAQRMAEPGNGAAEMTWLQEMHAVHTANGDLVSQIGALLSASARASAATHVAVASMLLDVIVSHITASFVAFKQRREWMEALRPAGDDGGGLHAPRKPLMPLFIRPPALDRLTAMAP